MGAKMRDYRGDAGDQSVDLGLERVAPGFGGGIGKIGLLDQRTRSPDQCVDAAMGGRDALDQRSDARRIADIAWVGGGLAPERGGLAGDGLRRVSLAVVDQRQIAAVGGEHFGDLAADSAAGAEHQRGSFGEQVHQSLICAPPLTCHTWPLTQAPSSEARNVTAAAMSSGRPRRVCGSAFWARAT